MPTKTMNSKAFTLLEVIVAIFVLTVGLGATFALIQQTLIASSLVEDRLVAAYLAQEGIELVRNIRDTNWLNQRFWDSSLNEGCWQLDYNDTALSACGGLPPNCSCPFLTIDNEGFYGYDGTTQTKFNRAIAISDKTVDEMKVFVKVEWTERGRTHTIEAVEYLTNWNK